MHNKHLKTTFFMIFFILAVHFIGSLLFGEESNKDLVYHILPHSLEEMEDTSYSSFLSRAFTQANSENASLIIVEIDTPGGELISTLKIKTILQNYGRETICFVNKNAISAGSLIALSCKKLVMSKGGVIGGATPVFMSGSDGMKKAPEKVVSVARAAWRAAAESSGKDPEVAEAFVDETLVLTKEKHGIDKPKGTLLTLSTNEALSIGIADYTAESLYDILKKEERQNAKIKIIKPEFKDKILSFFLHPAVSGILIALGFLGLLAEIKSPGWGIPGTAGILFLSIYFISRIMVGFSGWEAPALFALGILLLLLEFFVIPGFGIAGIAGAFCIFGSILWSYNITGIEEGLWVLAFALVGTIFGFFILAKLLPKIAQRNSFFLNENLDQDPDEMGEAKLIPFLNKTGIAETVLRPSGIIIVEGNRIDAVSKGEFIEKGDKIKIAEIKGNRVVIEKA